MLEKHDHLTITALKSKNDIEKYGMGIYKYLVYSDWTNHTAFKTNEGLSYWLRIIGLKIGENLNHLSNTAKIEGQYFTYCLLGIDTWTNKLLDNLDPKLKEIRNNLLDGSNSDLEYNCTWLSNGDYTKGFIEKTNEGNIIYYLNPNEHRRMKYHYFSIKE